MARARVRVPENLSDLLREDWESAIRSAPLGKSDRRIAELYLLDWTPMVDIGAELNMDRSTVSRRLPYILDKVERTAHKMGVI